MRQDTIELLELLDQIEILANGEGDNRVEETGSEPVKVPVTRLIKELKTGIARLRGQLPAEVRR